MYIDHLEIYYSRELIRKLHGIKSAVLFKVRDALRITEHYFIFSQSAIIVRSLGAKYRPDRYRSDKSVKFGTELP